MNAIGSCHHKKKNSFRSQFGWASIIFCPLLHVLRCHDFSHRFFRSLLLHFPLRCFSNVKTVFFWFFFVIWIARFLFSSLLFHTIFMITESTSRRLLLFETIFHEVRMQRPMPHLTQNQFVFFCCFFFSHFVCKPLHVRIKSTNRQ